MFRNNDEQALNNINGSQNALHGYKDLLSCLDTEDNSTSSYNPCFDHYYGKSHPSVVTPKPPSLPCSQQSSSLDIDGLLGSTMAANELEELIEQVDPNFFDQFSLNEQTDLLPLFFENGDRNEIVNAGSSGW